MNYGLEMERILQNIPLGHAPRLLLHSCCAPCSSSVLEILGQHFALTIEYYNPNIHPPEEYHRRAQEQQRYVQAAAATVEMHLPLFQPQEFYTAIAGLEALPEGGERCFACYALRLRHTALRAKAQGFDFFTTTLSVSPHKNATKLNEMGFALEKELGVAYLPADFKKKDGFKRSLVLSDAHGLYRQDYCGCVFSMEASRKRADAAQLRD